MGKYKHWETNSARLHDEGYNGLQGLLDHIEKEWKIISFSESKGLGMNSRYYSIVGERKNVEMSNKEHMISLCESMIKINTNSPSILAPINKLLWEQKLKYWTKENL